MYFPVKRRLLNILCFLNLPKLLYNKLLSQFYKQIFRNVKIYVLFLEHTFLNRSNTFKCCSCEPWEKLNLAISIPAFSKSLMVFSDQQLGPIVQSIFVHLGLWIGLFMSRKLVRVDRKVCTPGRTLVDPTINFAILAIRKHTLYQIFCNMQM